MLLKQSVYAYLSPAAALHKFHTSKSFKSDNLTGWNETKSNLTMIKYLCMESLVRSQLKIS